MPDLVIFSFISALVNIGILVSEVLYPMSGYLTGLISVRQETIFEFKRAHKLLRKMTRQIAVKCIENNHAPCDGSMLDADGVLLRCCFLLVYNSLGSGSTILLSLPDRMYSSQGIKTHFKTAKTTTYK